MASADNPVITPHSYEEAFVPPRISYCMFIDKHVQIVNNLLKENTTMSKSKEELNKLKEEVEAVNEKLAELTPEEIAQVNGGRGLVCGKRGLVPAAIGPGVTIDVK